MSTDISELEQQVEEFELLLNGGLHLTHDKLLDRINELWTLLKSRCQKNEINEEIVKRPIEQLTALLNVVNDVTDIQLGEKIRAIDAQANLVEQRLELLKDVDELKVAVNTKNLQNAAQLEDTIDQLTSKFTDITAKMQRLLRDSNKEQEDIDELLDYIESKLIVLESKRGKA